MEVNILMDIELTPKTISELINEFRPNLDYTSRKALIKYVKETYNGTLYKEHRADYNLFLGWSIEFEHEIDMARHHVGHRGRGTLIRNVHDVRAGHRTEQFRCEMIGRARRARAVVEPAGLRARERDELAHRVRGQ